MGPVQADDEGLEAGRRQVVHLVDGQEHPAVVGPGRLADLLEQPAQVAGQVARVGNPGHDLHVEEEGAPVGEVRVKALSTPSARRFTPFTFFLPPSLSRALRRATARRRGSAPSSPTSMCSWMKPRRAATRAELVQQNRLAHAAQAR